MLGIIHNEIQRSLTGLGDVPNDFEAGVDLCYTPVREGWVYGRPGLGQLEPMSSSKQNFYIVLQTLATVSITTLAILGVLNYRK